MELKQIYRGMQNGAETIQENFAAIQQEGVYKKNIFRGAIYFSDENIFNFNEADVHKGILITCERYDASTGKTLGYGVHTTFVPKSSMEQNYGKENRIPLTNTLKSFVLQKNKISGILENYSEVKRRDFVLTDITLL